KGHVAKKIGALARPDDLIFASDLPKTRSGKIMRRLLRDIAEGKALGDTTTLADPAVVARLKDQYGEEEEAGSGSQNREANSPRPAPEHEGAAFFFSDIWAERYIGTGPACSRRSRPMPLWPTLAGLEEEQ